MATIRGLTSSPTCNTCWNAWMPPRVTGGRSDLLLFHEFPITGFSLWTREQHYRLAIEVPGPETEAIAARAKQYGCYVAFGTYAKDPAWPEPHPAPDGDDRPDGELAARHWKQRNVRGMFPGGEQYTTAVYDVLDRFVEMYGQDAVIPIARTGIGNIALSAVQFEPELFRCMAFKGAEIICRVATGGFEYEDMRLTSYHNSLYTLICNNSVSTHDRNPGFLEDTAYGGPGRSAIFGPRGVETGQGQRFRDPALGHNPDRRVPPQAPHSRPAHVLVPPGVRPVPRALRSQRLRGRVAGEPPGTPTSSLWPARAGHTTGSRRRNHAETGTLRDPPDRGAGASVCRLRCADPGTCRRSCSRSTATY